MKTINKNETVQIIEKKSKFITYVYYIENVEQAEEKLIELRKKYYDASHHCYAYRIIKENNILEKSSDDGEPSGTAGQPILNVLSKNEIVNVIVIVIRYFGGTLLGAGGLVRAYSNSAKEAIEKAGKATIEKGIEIKLIMPYQNLESFKKYCNLNNVAIVDIKFEENIICQIQVSNRNKDIITLNETQNRFNIEKMQIMKELIIKMTENTEKWH